MVEPSPILGAGAHAYEAHHDWGGLPDRIRWGNCHGVQVDAKGLVYVHHTVHATSSSDHAVVVFDPAARFVTSWGSEFAGGAHGFQLVREGADEFLYFCDIRRSIVQKTDLSGNVLLTLGFPSESPAYARDEQRRTPNWKPTNLAVAANGDIYVADGYGSSFVVVYDKNGHYKNTFGGGMTDEPGKLNCPHGIAIDARSGLEEVLVADRANNRLQYFDLDGNHLRFVGGVDLPCHFDMAPDGTLLIPDLAARVTLMDHHNGVIVNLGEGLPVYRERRLLSREHFLPGKFVCPHGACFDHEGNIFVAEWVEIGRLTFLKRMS
jgi:DNA-binding beta-propeller fold protein YncE